jgi:hypothetical protein
MATDAEAGSVIDFAEIAAHAAALKHFVWVEGVPAG